MEKFELILIAILTIGACEGVTRQQSFSEAPSDVNAAIADTSVIKCRVANRAGNVQWTKDGLFLGFDRAIDGHDRYSLVGDAEQGVYDLQVRNVSLDDDADYECQVSPAANNRAIRGSAHLNVLLPPLSIELESTAVNGIIEVQQGTETELTCKVVDAKPVAVIKWTMDGTVFTPEDLEESESDGSKEERKTIESKIKLEPISTDNGKVIACVAEHEALKDKMTSEVTLSVLFPPSPPEIDHDPEAPVRLGQVVDMTCSSHGGNPMAEVTWLKNGEALDFSYKTLGRRALNELEIVAAAEDNGATYRCEVTSSQLPAPLSSEVKLEVLFPPDKVTISGDDSAKVGETIELECKTGNSNPASDIQWLVDNNEANGTSEVKDGDNGGFVTESKVSVTINEGEQGKKVMCYAIHHALGETIVESKDINVLYPPGRPNITGYQNLNMLTEGQSKRLSCISMGGNPLGDLKWFRGDEEIEGTTTEKDEDNNYSKSELLIVANRTDNGIDYKCEASNEADDSKKSASITMGVFFSPLKVEITVDPEEPVAGKKAILTCKSGTSNPSSALTWSLNGTVLNATDTKVKSGDYNGNKSSSLLEIDVTPAHHGSVFICTAKNPNLPFSVHNAMTLPVKYPPQFNLDDPEKHSVEVEEGKSVVINITAVANPAKITWKWKNPHRATVPAFSDEEGAELARIYFKDGVLNITKPERGDAGKYTLKASNEAGKSTLKLTVTVNYRPSIDFISAPLVANEGDRAEFTCTVDANPVKDKTIKWERSAFPESRMDVVREGNSVFLTVENVTKDDIGAFDCKADNGIGEAVVNTTFLLIRQAPKIDEDASTAKTASDKGAVADFTCQAVGAPEITFSWYRNGQLIVKDEDSEDEDKYSAVKTVVNKIRYESKLSLKNVTSEDYGPYACVADNVEGDDRYDVYLNVTSAPDPPSYLRVANVTRDTIGLRWTPGFDGGYPQRYRIRYQVNDVTNFHYIDTPEGVVDVFIVKGLLPSTEYTFSLMAYNSVGKSSYTPDIGKVKTLAAKHDYSGEDREIEKRISNWIISTLTICAACLLLLSFALIVCYVKGRQSHKRLESDIGSSTDSTVKITPGSSLKSEDILYARNGSILYDDDRIYEPPGDGLTNYYGFQEEDDFYEPPRPPLPSGYRHFLLPERFRTVTTDNL